MRDVAPVGRTVLDLDIIVVPQLDVIAVMR